MSKAKQLNKTGITRMPDQGENFTQVPNWILDGRFDVYQFRILTLIARQTCGYHRKYDRISLTYIEKHAGISRPKIVSTLKTLEFCVTTTKSFSNGAKDCNVFSLKDADEVVNHINYPSKQDELGVVNDVNRGSKQDELGVVNDVNIHKETLNKLSKENKSASNESRLSPKKVLPSPPAEINETAWAEFVEHRAEIKKPLTPRACTILWNLLQTYSPDTQQAMIDKAISNRWTGIFPLKKEFENKPQAKGYDPLGVDSTDWIHGCSFTNRGHGE